MDSNRLEIQIMQMVRLMQDGVEVKMSKRTGNAITLREIMDEVGIDVARYFLTMRSPDSHFDFDLNLPKKSHKIIHLLCSIRACTYLLNLKTSERTRC